MKMLVLAGGFGTRLQTAVADVPKALAPVGGVPFLQLQIENWIGQGLCSFVFLLHHQADQVIRFLRAQQTGVLDCCQVEWVIEPSPLNTGGAVAYAVRELSLEGDFLLTNADTWLGNGVRELAQTAAPAMAVLNVTDVNRFGHVHFDISGRVTAFEEKSARLGSGWINAGLCHLDAGLFADWDGNPCSLERDFFPALVRCDCLMAVPLHTDFIDIGVPDDYRRFCRWMETGRKTPLCI